MLVLVACGGLPARAQSPALLPYLVQDACLDSAGAVRPGVLPTDPACGPHRRPLSVTEPLPYHKHDWPDRRFAATQPRGYVASDSLLGTLLGQPAIIHTFDFGDDPQHAFGRFDAGRGDGAQAVLIDREGAAAVAVSEDAQGIHWFQSPACQPGTSIPAPGWLLAVPPLSETWQQRVVQLYPTMRVQQCPSAFVHSLTRWRRGTIEMPMREAREPAQPRHVSMDVIVTDHFGRAEIGNAENMERMVLARGLGLVRWERWEDRATSRDRRIAQGVELMREAQTCPPIALGEPPGPTWVMTTCRMWTNMLRAPDAAAMTRAPAWPLAAGR